MYLDLGTTHCELTDAVRWLHFQGIMDTASAIDPAITRRMILRFCLLTFPITGILWLSLPQRLAVMEGRRLLCY